MDEKANGLDASGLGDRSAKPLTAAARRAARAGLERVTKDRGAGSFTRADQSLKDAATEARRRASNPGFTAASACAKDAMRGAASRRGVADPRLLTRWSEIVGDRLGGLCRPVRIKHRSGLALGGVLVLAVDRAHASEIEHELGAIRERVNAFFGHCAVAEVKITQSVDAALGAEAALLTEDKAAPADEPDPIEALPAGKKRELDALTAPVADDALRDALARLGANVMTETAARRSRKREQDAT